MLWSIVRLTETREDASKIKFLRSIVCHACRLLFLGVTIQFDRRVFVSLMQPLQFSVPFLVVRLGLGRQRRPRECQELRDAALFVAVSF